MQTDTATHPPQNNGTPITCWLEGCAGALEYQTQLPLFTCTKTTCMATTTMLSYILHSQSKQPNPEHTHARHNTHTTLNTHRHKILTHPHSLLHINSLTPTLYQTPPMHQHKTTPTPSHTQCKLVLFVSLFACKHTLHELQLSAAKFWVLPLHNCQNTRCIKRCLRWGNHLAYACH